MELFIPTEMLSRLGSFCLPPKHSGFQGRRRNDRLERNCQNNPNGSAKAAQNFNNNGIVACNLQKRHLIAIHRKENTCSGTCIGQYQSIRIGSHGIASNAHSRKEQFLRRKLRRLLMDFLHSGHHGYAHIHNGSQR